VLLTKTGKAYGDGSGQANIAESHYDEFADYLATIAEYFKEQGTPFNYISPVNEPQWDWSQDNGQEGSPYQNEQIDGVVTALDQKLREYNLDSKIEIPETAQINFLYDGDLTGRNHQTEHFFGSDSKVKDLETVARKMAAHSYFTTWPVSDMIDKRRQVRESIENSAAVPTTYAMSEYCILADNEEIQGNGRDLGMDPALYVARVLHFDMTIANATSWQWWLAISPYDYKDGLVYIDKDTQNGTVSDSKLLWGLGNFSRFIRPGAVRLEISRSDNATPEEAAREVMASAYSHEDQGTLTVVLVNYGTTDKPVNVSPENTGNRSLSDFDSYLTSGQTDLEKQKTVSWDESVIVPARSIMTLHANIQIQ
jgi:O-glycosyl hydrolase